MPQNPGLTFLGFQKVNSLSNLILDTGYVKHVESRLITMFPNDAFVGLIAYSDSVMADILASAPTYIDTLEFVESDTIPSFGMEAKILALDSTESIAWNEFETLAQGFNLGTPATLEDIIDASTSAKTSGVLGWMVAHPVIVTGGAATIWMSFRICQSGWRARNQSTGFYPNMSSGDTKRDACRHIIWQMLTRRYCGKATAWIVGWGKEEIGSSNTCAAKNMDYHNNLIGRSTKYSDFRDWWGTHAWEWRTWCTNVHSYIENANSPIFVDGDWTSWNSTTFTLIVIKDCDDIEDDRKNNFNKKKYIYLKP